MTGVHQHVHLLHSLQINHTLTQHDEERILFGNIVDLALTYQKAVFVVEALENLQWALGLNHLLAGNLYATNNNCI